MPREPNQYKTYAEYLAHPEFKKIRERVMRASNWKCKVCGKAATQVHHLKYPKWGEFDDDCNLLPVCNACHCHKHGKDN